MKKVSPVFIGALLIMSCSCNQGTRKINDGGNILTISNNTPSFEELVYRESEKGIDTLSYVFIDVRTGRPYCVVAKDLPLGIRIHGNIEVRNDGYYTTAFDIEYYDLKELKLKIPFGERFNLDDLRVKGTVIPVEGDTAKKTEYLYGNFERIPGAPAGGSAGYSFGGYGKEWNSSTDWDWNTYDLFSHFLGHLYKERTMYRQVISDGSETKIKTRSF